MVTLSLRRAVFTIFDFKNAVTLKRGLGVTQGHRKLYHSIWHLLTFISNHRPISHRFRDKRRFPSKIAWKSPFFPPCVFNATAEDPWNWVSAQRSEETRMMGLPDDRKSFKIGLAVLIQYRRVMETQPASQPRCRSKYALCISASCSKKWSYFAIV